MNKWLWTALILLLVIISAGAYLYWDLLRYAERASGSAGSETVVIVPAGQGFRSMADRLAGAGVIVKTVNFRIYARIKGYDKRIQAGEYLLSAAMSPDKILRILADGRVRLHKITIPEGFNLKQIAEVLAKSMRIPSPNFLKSATDRGLAQTYGIGAGTFEGYLFPDTYFFPKPIAPEKIISIMADRFWEKFRPEWKTQAERLGMSIHEVVTLASMIEKETGVPSERAMISSVFHNRLKKGMRLECDPTVIYGLDDFNGNLTREHLKIPSPYNTYQMKGLPFGPIANPGSAAIESALYPAEASYFFFVAKKDRTHQFSTTIAEHNRAVRKYQLRR